MSRASTPRREGRASDVARRAASPARTPSAQQGLVISKLGVQATTSEDKVEGIMCLKVALPRDSDGHPQRWGIFSGTRPKLKSIPALYPLPASLALSSTSSHLTAATTLLGLPPAGSYPPQTASDTTLRPYIDVSAASGQVFVCTDGTPPGANRRKSISRDSSRSEWLVVVEFEVDVESILDGTEEVFKTIIPTPKCLDNVIRYLIVPKNDDPTEVTIATEPKILPLPRGVFRSSLGNGPSTPSRKHPFEEGWEDGEVHGVESDDEGDNDAGSWLEGRFQSTDAVVLEWSFVPTRGAEPSLRITPQWNESHPEIDIVFEATIDARPGPFGLEAVLPPGWGWSSLQIRADGLFSWRSADGQSLGALVSATVSGGDESTSTIGSFSPRRGSTPPIALAPLDAGDDFSFEQSSYLERPRLPQTPTRRSLGGERTPAAVLRVVPRSPTPAALFECEFEHDEDEDDDSRVISLEGTLQPLRMTLVSPDTPVPIPIIRFNDPSLPLHTTVACPAAMFIAQDEDEEAHGDSRTLDTSAESIGTFTWTDASGQPLPAREPVPVSGRVRVAAQRNVWGVQTISCMIPWPAEAEEITLRFPRGSARVVRAHARGSPLPHNVVTGEGGNEVRVHGGRGQVEVVVEVANDDVVAIPTFPSGTGDLHVELVGDGWDKLLREEPQTSLKQTKERIFVGPMSDAEIRFAQSTALIRKPEQQPLTTPPKRSFARRIVSWNTLFHLLLLWVIVSLAQQVQRLRTEVAYVADEARDLRLYGYGRASAPPPPPPTANFEHYSSGSHVPASTSVSIPADPGPCDGHDAYAPDDEFAQEGTTDVQPVPNYDIGRTVFGRGGWEQWLRHPAIHRLSDTMAWLWRAVVWLIAPA